ncbi:acyl-CoA N-acyltransferase [Staphylotrichum tortipilum]|uniref:Histone acetyltransferase type B catalytic subunit n=1 Tax=Staphylotrichum tortipilum TaxID=2831512 RepID=A0AAN6MR03_9PEZI|nr:acyl-CoA N-acyltransferase [Staphylotrichum longicolle]
MSSDDAWSTPSNDALFLSLVSPTATGVKTVGHSFNPKFTYPIFGDSEEIFGYQNLEINIRYNASDMRPNLSVSHTKKFAAVGETEATDITGILHEFLPDVAFQKKSEFETAIKSLRADWTPPGELDTTFQAAGGTFEIWKGTLADPAVKQLIMRMQILVPLFIEGGTAIDADEVDAERWTVFFLYQKRTGTAADASTNPYVFAGYCTVYRFFHFRLPTPPQSPPSETDLENATLAQDFDLAQLPCRTRISQFLVLPLFQGRGLGPRLYNHIFAAYIAHPQTVEITVEDPNEAFDDLRDIADLQYLRGLPEFLALRIDTTLALPRTGPAPAGIVDQAACDAVRARAKMAPRQFARVLEMQLMSRLPKAVRPGFAPPEEEGAGKGKGKGKVAKPTAEETHEYRLWRLLLKKRIYKHNRDALGELEIPERIAKLDETVSSVEFDYARLLIRGEEQRKNAAADAEANRKVVAAAAVAAGENGTSTSANGKRKAEEDGEPSVSKKARVEDE